MLKIRAYLDYQKGKYETTAGVSALRLAIRYCVACSRMGIPYTVTIRKGLAREYTLNGLRADIPISRELWEELRANWPEACGTYLSSDSRFVAPGVIPYTKLTERWIMEVRIPNPPPVSEVKKLGEEPEKKTSFRKSPRFPLGEWEYEPGIGYRLLHPDGGISILAPSPEPVTDHGEETAAEELILGLGWRLEAGIPGKWRPLLGEMDVKKAWRLADCVSQRARSLSIDLRGPIPAGANASFSDIAAMVQEAMETRKAAIRRAERRELRRKCEEEREKIWKGTA